VTARALRDNALGIDAAAGALSPGSADRLFRLVVQWRWVTRGAKGCFCLQYARIFTFSVGYVPSPNSTIGMT
jgi:hypothetical protein